MGERYLQWVYPGEVPDYERADPAEVLEEMPFEALVAEFKRRAHKVVMDEGALLLWFEHTATGGDGPG